MRVLLSALSICIILMSLPAKAEERTIMIGIAKDNMPDQLLGTAICALINSGSPKHGILCSTPVHEDQAANLEALRSGQQTMAIVSSDWQHYAYEGLDKFNGRPFRELRSILSAEPQSFTLVAGRDSGIKTLADLKSRRVTIGNPGSLQRSLMDVVLRAKGWTLADFSETLELKAEDQIAALCDSKADAAVFAAVHPDPLIEQAVTSCGARIVPAADEDIVRLIDDSTYFTEAVIPSGTYMGEKKEIVSFGLPATLVTTKGADRKLIYDSVRTIFENFDQLQKLNPASAVLDEMDMTRAGLSAPLHASALRYFREEDLQ